MPYEWVKDMAAAPERSGAAPLCGEPLAELRLWPHRSLGARGFVTFFAITAALVAVPLLAMIGTPVLWGVLPFFVVTLWAMWAAIARNNRDSALTEELTLWPDRITLSHRPPRGPEKTWEANPHWVRVTIRHAGGPVADYITLKGAGREVELGAFLSDEERRALFAELNDRLARLR